MTDVAARLRVLAREYEQLNAVQRRLLVARAVEATGLPRRTIVALLEQALREGRASQSGTEK